MALLGDLIVKVGAQIDGFEQAMRSVVDRADVTAKDIEKKLESVSNVGERLATVGAGMSALITLPILGVGAAALKTAGEFEQTEIAFTHFLGSAKAGKAYLEELYTFAAQTPFEIGGVTKGAQQLMAMEFAAKDVIPTLRVIGDQLSAVGRMNMMENVIRAFGQMKARGVVSMEEINQLSENAAINGTKMIAEAMGKTTGEVTDLMKKRAISAADGIQAILAGMAKRSGGMMAEQMNSFDGMMSNVKDNLTRTLKDIGDQLLPYAKVFANFAGQALEATKSVAKGFGDLPEPIKVAMLAFVALVAAVGPVLVVLGGIMMAIAPLSAVVGMAAAPFLLWAVAIGGAVAALAGLGSWIATNWEPIKASVAMGWSGVSEIWSAVWSKLGGVLSTSWTAIANTALGIWTAIEGAARSIWGAIGGFVISVVQRIGEYFQIAWKMATGVVNGMIGLLAKIPGVDKIFNVAETFRSTKAAEELAASIKKLGEAHKVMGGDIASTTPRIIAATGATKLHGQAIDDTHGKLVRWNQKLLEYEIHQDAANKKLAEGTIQLAAFSAEWSNGTWADEAQAIWENMEKLDETSKKAHDTLKALNDIKPVGLSEMDRAVYDLNEAFKTLGIDSTAALKEQASQAQKAYETIRNSGTASARDLEAAWVRMEEARQRAARQAGEVITAQEGRELSRRADALDDNLKHQQGAWGDFADAVGSNIGSISSRITNDLFKGEFGLKSLITVVQDIGKAFVKAFVDVAANAVAKFVTNQLKSLNLSLSDIISKIGSILSGLGKILGIGGSAAGGAASAAGGATQAAGGVAQAAGAAAGSAGSVGSAAASAGSSSITGIVGAVAGVVTAASGVYSNIQQHRMETDIGRIEVSNRAIQNDLANLRADEWARHTGILEKFDQLRVDLLNKLNGIWYSIGAQLGTINESILRGGGKSSSVVININGAQNAKDVADQVVKYLKLNGVIPA